MFAKTPMQAKAIKCTLKEKTWVTPTVMTLRFEPAKKFNFQPGQFLSLIVPSPESKGKAVKRCYSLSNAPNVALKEGYELCVKYVPGGKGTSFLSSLEVGDTFHVQAPYGDFQYSPPKNGKNVCFIATGTGMAPIRSIIQSDLFQKHRPEHTMLLFGARTEEEILYRGEFEKMGIEVVHALSQPQAGWLGFKGRVTDILRNLPREWAWHATDFYICGNPEMVRETNAILHGGHGISLENICKEAFEATGSKKKVSQDQKILPQIRIVAA